MSNLFRRAPLAFVFFQLMAAAAFGQTIAGTVRDIDSISGAVAAAAEEQQAATQEIARNVQQAAVGTQEVSSNIAGVTNAADSAGEASRTALGAAGDLNSQAEALVRAVDQFLGRLRAA